jgi:hypothetical protein
MRTWMPACCIVVLAGCSAERFVPVSGVVTLNGKPLAGADVTFVPIHEDKESTKALPSSSGKTDDAGRYSLKGPKDAEGALPGKHRVSILLIDPRMIDSDKRRRASEPPLHVLPERYNRDTELTCDVPPEGKTDANFALTSP